MKILYLNIDQDTTSRDLTEAELTRVGIKAERVPAITGDNRPLAFNKSVYKAMKMAEGQQLLLMEDDVMFTVDTFNELAEGDCFLWPPLPSDYMTLHLGANIIGTDQTVWQMPTKANHIDIARLWNCWQSHATLYSAECVKFILDNMNPNVINEDQHIFDDWLRTTVLPMGRSYVMKPMIAYQRPRFSAIWQRDSDYTGCFKQGNEYLKRL